MANVRIDEPDEMNVLGLFLARALRRNLEDRGRPAKLRGTLAVTADGMRAAVRFEPDGAVVTRAAEPARTTLEAPLAVFVAALVRPSLRSLLRVKVRGGRIFALRALGYLKP